MAINTKTYLSKVNTIVKDSYVNTGLNPIMELNYGKMLTRGLIYFDHSKLQCLVNDKVYPDISKLKHVLKMYNAASINDRSVNETCIDSQYNDNKERASSFDLIFFLLPNEFDEGRGFDYVYDLYNGNHRAVQTNGSNWFNYNTFKKWENEGVYSTERLSNELDLFTSKQGNLSKVIVAFEHFDYGNEMIEVDLTNIVNKFITNEIPNYGLGIAFSPRYEELSTNLTQYVGFFTPHTPSFFEPYIETTYNDYINDDRNNFYLDKDNKLYFYAFVGGKYVNLDNLPTCTIEGREYPSKQATKGIYYVDINLSSEEFESDNMYYDIWSDINYNGKSIKDVELDFTTKSSEGYFTFGLPSENTEEVEVIPSLSGISHMEQIKRGDIRKVNISCKIPYTTNQEYSLDNLEYRLYVMQGVDEMDIIQWSNVERVFNNNYFLINTNELLPSRYYVDIKVKYNNEIIIHHKQLRFDIINDTTTVYV